MSKIIEALEAAGWVDTTLGECRPGEEAVIEYEGHVWNVCITSVDVTQGTITNTMGFQWAAETPALRPPRPEYAPGTVALITWDGQDEPMRAMRLSQDWTTVDDGYVLEGSAEVVRVLLPADQDTPPITDEMVERAAEACYLARYKEDAFGPRWDEACERFPAVVALFRREARTALKTALEVEK